MVDKTRTKTVPLIEQWKASHNPANLHTIGRVEVSLVEKDLRSLFRKVKTDSNEGTIGTLEAAIFGPSDTTK
ncbi:MAG: hypothetical protein ABSA33_04625 [Candidatus Micrarchaeaceae archaeon]